MDWDCPSRQKGCGFVDAPVERERERERERKREKSENSLKNTCSQISTIKHYLDMREYGRE